MSTGRVWVMEEEDLKPKPPQSHVRRRGVVLLRISAGKSDKSLHIYTASDLHPDQALPSLVIQQQPEHFHMSMKSSQVQGHESSVAALLHLTTQLQQELQGLTGCTEHRSHWLIRGISSGGPVRCSALPNIPKTRYILPRTITSHLLESVAVTKSCLFIHPKTAKLAEHGLGICDLEDPVYQNPLSGW